MSARPNCFQLNSQSMRSCVVAQTRNIALLYNGPIPRSLEFRSVFVRDVCSFFFFFKGVPILHLIFFPFLFILRNFSCHFFIILCLVGCSSRVYTWRHDVWCERMKTKTPKCCCHLLTKIVACTGYPFTPLNMCEHKLSVLSHFYMFMNLRFYWTF